MIRANAVALVGFMGAGKSSVGQALAQRLSWEFVDLDKLIENQENRTIADIFRESGEAAFRQIESRVLAALLTEISSGKGTVAALGGGAFAQEENAKRLRQNALPTVFLDAPFEELHRRCAVGTGTRPLFKDENQFRQLYELRQVAYMRADYRVNTGGKSITQVAEEIAAILSQVGKR